MISRRYDNAGTPLSNGDVAGGCVVRDGQRGIFYYIGELEQSCFPDQARKFVREMPTEFVRQIFLARSTAQNYI